jgi:GNAT superfamily N-acetyltransferase
MNNQELLRIAMEQQAIDLSCAPEDFLSTENKVVVSRENPKARSYLTLPVFCNFASFGNNVVAAVHPAMAETVSQYVNTRKIEDCFTVSHIFTLNEELQRHGYQLSFCAQRTLPDLDIIKPLPCAYELRILQPEDYAHLYGTSGLGNAIGSGKRKHLDRIAIGAYEGGTLIGLAGSSADCEKMWQIGVDVLPAYRRKGVASSLITHLATEILDRGFVPYAGCRWANIRSLKTQLAIGFKPVWVDMLASPLEPAAK